VKQSDAEAAERWRQLWAERPLTLFGTVNTAKKLQEEGKTMTDLERLDSTIQGLEKLVEAGGFVGQAERSQCLFHLGVLQFLRGVLATESRGEEA
jgi:hypothetical protein